MFSLNDVHFYITFIYIYITCYYYKLSICVYIYCLSLFHSHTFALSPRNKKKNGRLLLLCIMYMYKLLFERIIPFNCYLYLTIIKKNYLKNLSDEYLYKRRRREQLLQAPSHVCVFYRLFYHVAPHAAYFFF